MNARTTAINNIYAIFSTNVMKLFSQRITLIDDAMKGPTSKDESYKASAKAFVISMGLDTKDIDNAVSELMKVVENKINKKATMSIEVKRMIDVNCEVIKSFCCNLISVPNSNYVYHRFFVMFAGANDPISYNSKNYHDKLTLVRMFLVAYNKVKSLHNEGYCQQEIAAKYKVPRFLIASILGQKVALGKTPVALADRKRIVALRDTMPTTIIANRLKVSTGTVTKYSYHLNTPIFTKDDTKVIQLGIDAIKEIQKEFSHELVMVSND